MTTSVERIVGRVMAAAGPDPEDDDIGELEIAEYVVFLLALDTYSRYVEETSGEGMEDALIHHGLQLVRIADRRHLETIRTFLDTSVPTPGQKKLIDKAFKFLPSNAASLSRRTFNVRTVFSRSGPTTMRAVFKTNKALQEIKAAMAAALTDDADEALDKFAVIHMKNPRLRKWIDQAAASAGSGAVQNPIAASSSGTSDDAEKLLVSRTQQQAASPTSDDNRAELDTKDDLLQQVQQTAVDAAQRAMAVSGERDEPPVKSEVIGLATAAAVAAVTDPSISSNVPEPLRKLDDEQRAAALTDGRVLVAAGAGAGKSTTVVSRVEYLVKDRRVLPSRILVTSFNTKAANELKQKIGSAVGADGLNQMSVGTMHSLFRKFIGEYGTSQERSAMGVGKDRGGFVQGGAAVARAVQRLWSECYPADSDRERKVPKLKNVLMAKSKWSGNSVTPADAKAQARTQDDIDAADWYEMYEGLKGSLPGWKPPCGTSKGYESFMAKWRPSNQRLGDFDDMLGIFETILKREPMVRKTLQGMFDHLIVDEAQDLSGVQFSIISQMAEHITDGKDGKSLWICGDDKQCVASETLVSVSRGATVQAKDLHEGQEVLAYRNGVLTSQVVRHVKPSAWTWGYKITTASGKTLTMSPNHKIWATQPEVPEGSVAVYLMYRGDMGFRIGVTNKGYSEDYLNSFGGRAFMEKAERMWFLEICPDREQALLSELRYSLKYGVPTAVFEGENRGLNQDRIDAVFAEFGKNGGRILEDKHLSFDLPHWMSRSYSKHGRTRRTIQMIAHSAHNTQVAMEWMGDDLDEVLQAAGIVWDPTSKGTKRIRKWFSNYREGLFFAEKLQEATKANLQRRLSTDEGPLQLLTASALFSGMSVAVVQEDCLVHDEIVLVEQVGGLSFVDLDVADASNFIGGGILSHNSIYGFRGARPDLFTQLNTTPGWTTKMIRTNYRCQPEIVDCANKLITFNENQIPMEAVASPAKVRGVGSVRVNTTIDEADAALDVVEEIKANIGAGEDVANNAILTRTNKEQHAFETACIIRGVPYARKGASSFLGSPETKAFLSYVQLVTGDDFGKMQGAFGEIINKPNRFFIAPDAGVTAVQDAISAYARHSGQDIKSVSPLAALNDRFFVSVLAEKLTRVRAGFKFDKAIEKIFDIRNAIEDMRASASDPRFTTKDLFDGILGMTGTVAVTDRSGRTTYVEQTFRDSLKADLRDSVSEDDDESEEDDTEGLGNVSFLYALAKKDPTDPEDLVTDPNTPFGFKAKMERYAARARDLRIDLTKWDKEQAALPPEQRKAPPGVYLGTVHCSPADEPVLTTDGWVAIGELDPERHRLTSYASTCNQLFWGDAKSGHDGPVGYGFVKATMPYKGPLLTLTTLQSKTRLTPDHRIRVKWSESFYNKYVVYLMRRGDWWRVGAAKSGNRPYGGSDFKQRVSAEKADACWILSVHSTRTEAILEEAKIQGIYGITGLTFEANTNRRVSSAQLHRIHEAIQEATQARVEHLLTDHGFDKRNPLYVGQGRDVDMRSAFTTQARNCLSGYMLLPVVSKAFVDRTGPRDVWTKPEWHEVSVTREPFDGDVYSLSVPPHHFYVSGGAVVHNSVKGAQWRNCYVSMPKGKFPFMPPQKPGQPPPPPEVEQEEMESERRLGYVALTRAAMNLTIVCPSSVGGKPAGVSPFVVEAGLKIGENVPKPGAPTPSADPTEPVKTATEYEGLLPEEWHDPATQSYDRRQS
jgi:DNA helicase-2/ATP-dependent DNA helicase PcrA